MGKGRRWGALALAAALLSAGARAEVFIYRGLVPSADGAPPTPVEFFLEAEAGGRLSGNALVPDLLGQRGMAIRGVVGRQCLLLFGNGNVFEGRCSARELVGRWREGDAKPMPVRFAGGGAGLGGDPAYDSNARTATRLACPFPASPLLATPESVRATGLLSAFAAGDGAALASHRQLFADMAQARARLDYSGAELDRMIDALVNPAAGPAGAVQAQINQSPARTEALAKANASYAEITRLFGNWFDRAGLAQAEIRAAVTAADVAMAARIAQLPDDRAGADALVETFGRVMPGDACAIRPAPALTEAVKARAARFGPALADALAARASGLKEESGVRNYARTLRDSGVLNASTSGTEGIARIEAEARRRSAEQQAAARVAEQARTDAAVAQLEAARRRGPVDIDLAAAYTNAFWEAHGPQKQVLVNAGILSRGQDFVVLDLMGRAAEQMGTSAFFNYKEVWSFTARDVRCTPRSATVSVCTYKLGWEIDVEQPGSNILRSLGMGNLDRTVRSQLNDAIGQPLKEVTDTFTRTASGWTSPAIAKRMVFLHGRAESMRGALGRSGASGPTNPKTGTDLCRSLAAGVLAGGGDMSGPAGRMYQGAGC